MDHRMSETQQAGSPRYDADDTAGVDALKAAFRHHPAGVSLITASTPEGPVGLTASSVASVGIDPATISFSVTRATGSAGGILGADSFVVHLLDARHAALAATFAVSGTDRFTPEQGWSELVTGEPYLPDTRVALRCRILHSLGVGSSVIVVAEVLGAVFGAAGDAATGAAGEADADAAGDAGAAAAPMVHIDRTFRGLGDEITR